MSQLHNYCSQLQRPKASLAWPLIYDSLFVTTSAKAIDYRPRCSRNLLNGLAGRI